MKPIFSARSLARPRPAVVGLAIVSGVLAVAMFTRMTSVGVSSDILTHARIAQNEWDAGWWYTYTFWSPLLFIASFGGNLVSLRTASIALLSLAVVLKVLLAHRLTHRWGAMGRQATALAAALLVSTPILALHHAVLNAPRYSSTLSGAIYLGRISGVVWHNSTMIACAPLVLLAAGAARRAYESPDLRRLVGFGATLALSALMKPNYALAALPVLLPVLLWRANRNRVEGQSYLLMGATGIAGPTLVVLVLQLALVRRASFIVPLEFTFEPMTVWRYYASSPALALLQSLAFPLVATLVTVLISRHGHAWLAVSWAITAVAIVQLALFGERNRVTSEPVLAGNWFWGPHLAVLVLFLASGAALASAQRSEWLFDPSERASYIRRFGPAFAWVVLAAHVLSGLLYVFRLFKYDFGFAT